MTVLHLVVLSSLLAPAPTVTFTFAPAVGNVEYATDRMWPRPPGRVTRSPSVAGHAWYGQIVRRLPEEAATLRTVHSVPFVAEYVDGVAVRAWCDTDFDGDLSNEPPLPLAAYPGPEGARSFLVDLKWTARLGATGTPIERLMRVVLEPTLHDAGPEGDASPRYRLQMVHAMMGEVTLEGKRHRAFLFDGNLDGFYTPDLLDGMFVDLDDDGHFVIDQMSPEFASFSVPFTMGHESYEVVSVDPAGRQVSMRDLGPAVDLPPPPAAGKPAPGFSYVDTEGRSASLQALRGRFVLVYFWSSWCFTCAGQAEGLKQLYAEYHPAGLEILGVSYDTDREAMQRFRQRHGHVWPTSFSGRQVWEDPIGRLYRARGSGVLYLIDPDGILQGTYSELDQLGSRLAALMASTRTGQRPSPVSVTSGH